MSQFSRCLSFFAIFCLLNPATSNGQETPPKDDRKAAESSGENSAGEGTQTTVESDSDETNDAIKPLVVHLEVARRTYTMNYPWRAKSSSSGGSGVLISNRRILTNAHVVIYAHEIRVEREGESRKLDARVVGVCHERDLAVVELEDGSFGDDIEVLPIADGLPKPQDEVRVFGYPIGGDSVSVTKGIISRVEYSSISHGWRGFRIQVDAALNPGNSGGPAFSDGKVVGVVTSGIRSADNIGYLVSALEIQTFPLSSCESRKG